MLTIARCLVVGLGLGLDLVSCRLVVMHTYLYYLPLSIVTLPMSKPTQNCMKFYACIAST